MRAFARAACAASLLVVASVAAQAAGSGCAALKWPLDAEKAAFADASIESVASGASRGPWRKQAFLLKLQPAASVSLVAAPSKSKGDGGHAGLLTFDPPEAAGTYQVTISDQGWLDVVQHGAPLKSADHTGVKDCPGLRKSVRFAVAKEPVVLQVTGAVGAEIKVAITPVE
jgi:hypothetical protein